MQPETRSVLPPGIAFAEAASTAIAVRPNTQSDANPEQEGLLKMAFQDFGWIDLALAGIK